MAEFFTIANLVDLTLLIALQAVLGFDNLLYISLESQRAPLEKQKQVRFWGIVLAVVFRIVLLFLLLKMIAAFQQELFRIHWEGVIHATFTLHAIIVLFGGVFILYTAMKEILHMMTLEESHAQERSPKSIGSIIFWIVAMNVVFSFDSILSAMAVTKVFYTMATAIIIGGILMVALADTVSEFLKKNRMYEVMGLFILFLVGVMLLSEGGHLSHMTLFGNEVIQMSKTTFYFVLTVLIVSDIVQSRYQKKLNQMKQMSSNK
ncbi:TerC family protein [Arenicella sp. 4NH20-0111]|uniref:TerC family protein n=1 Tax=Arenicella sp. 4NH20-0111 TaxID=3127648 RepID=UPI003109348A